MITGKKIAITGYLMAALFVLMSFLLWVLAFKAVHVAHKELRGNSQLQDTPEWHSMEARRLKKDIHWYQQLLMLSKSDSNYLTIDLNDSLVQLKLKGISLAEAGIIYHYPADFLTTIEERVYTPIATISPIFNESASFPKKPVRRIVAFSNADARNEETSENLVDKPLQWTFTTGSNLKIVISGVQSLADSTFALHPRQDILLSRAKEIKSHPVAENYSPTLYLWLSDKDAKAIYRAVPSGGKVLFRN